MAVPASVAASALSAHSFGSWNSRATRAANDTNRSAWPRYFQAAGTAAGSARPWNVSRVARTVCQFRSCSGGAVGGVGSPV